MLTDIEPPTRFDFSTHHKLSKVYGVKAAGLSFLPSAWRLDFAALTIAVHQCWSEGGNLKSLEEIKALEDWLLDKDFQQIILRSSGTSETLQDRGKFESVILGTGWNFARIINQLEFLYEKAKHVDASATLGIVVQEYLAVKFAGHLSNEHRVSPTINQWSYELEKPDWAPAKGLNSKLSTSPDSATPLRCGNQIPHKPLRSIAHFLAEEFSERCHIEWMVHESTLILAQIDFEWPETDQGIDPKKDIRSEQPLGLDLNNVTSFTPYKIGTKTKWPKLQNLSDFDFQDGNLPPRIYPLSPKKILDAYASQSSLDELKLEMISLTGNRLVVRTECIQKGIGKFNLPRTETMNAESALDWCRSTMKLFQNKGVSERNYVFLFHAFLPARAAAWAYAKPENPVVIVDALWGLPDGLQVLPVDTYEVNVNKGKLVQTKTTFKPKFLTELSDGTWDYRYIKSQCGRHQVLSNADKLEIAQRTANIARKLGEDAQIMWFCNIPKAYQVGRNLPWFRSREIFDPAPRQEVRYKPFKVSTPRDLELLPNEKVTLQLSPEADLIRDEAFLDAIVAVAKEVVLLFRPVCSLVKVDQGFI